MDQKTHKWKKQISGNLAFADLKNPLRNFIEKQIPSIKITDYPDRPKKGVNLSIGDPTLSPEFRTHPENLQTIASNVGKIDGYTSTQGLDQARKALSQKYQALGYKITKNDVYMCNGGSLAIWATMMLLAD